MDEESNEICYGLVCRFTSITSGVASTHCKCWYKEQACCFCGDVKSDEKSEFRIFRSFQKLYTRKPNDPDKMR